MYVFYNLVSSFLLLGEIAAENSFKVSYHQLHKIYYEKIHNKRMMTFLLIESFDEKSYLCVSMIY